MTHRAESIIAAVVTKVTGLTTTGTRVIRGRVRTVEVAPALSVEMGSDDVNPDANTYPLIGRDLNIKITAYVKTNTSPDTQLNLIREEVYIAIIADTTLGLSYVTDTMLIGDEEPSLTGEADQIVGTLQMNYVIKYRHSWTNPGA